MRDPVSSFLFCACVAAAVSGSGVVRVGVWVALTCDDVGPHRQAVLNATVTAAMSPTTQEAKFNALSVELDVVDACVTQHSVSRLTSALEDSSYLALAGPGLYHLCGIASYLQRSRLQVRYFSSFVVCRLL